MSRRLPRLNTTAGLLQELARVYRLAVNNRMRWDDAKSAAYILQRVRMLLVVSDFDARLRELEEERGIVRPHGSNGRHGTAAREVAMNEYERRLLEIRRRPRTLPTKLRPEHEAFLASLTIDTLKWINWQHLRHPELSDDGAALVELGREAERLNDQDRQGLLPYGWWQAYTPSWLKPAVDG